MSLWTRGGICGSPVSSDDDGGDVFAYEDDVGGENLQENAPRVKIKPAKKAKTTTIKAKAKATAKTAAPAPPLKRRRGSDKTSSGKGEDDAPLTKVPRVLGKKELVRGAPQRFVEYLADQLAPATQAQYCEEFGTGQGVMLRMPTSWNEMRERRAFGEWAVQLGFVASKVHRHLHRISSLNVEIVLAELRTRVRVHSESDSFPVDTDVSMNLEVDAEPEPHFTEAPTSKVKGEDEKPAISSKKEEATSLQTFKDHFQRLDLEHLEMLTVAEHDRLLSTIRHEQIADAMEEVLARSSVRKIRDRARRMSKLGRIAERRLSVIPMRQSMLPLTIMEDADWDEDDLDEEFAQLRAPETIMEEDEEDLMEDETAELTDEKEDTKATEEEETGAEDPFTTPCKSNSAMRTRRSSVGSVETPGRRVSFASVSTTPTCSSARITNSTPAKTPDGTLPLTPTPTPKRSPESKAPSTPLRTPIWTPKKTALQTPPRTPLRTPQRSSMSAFDPRRSSISKLGVAELRRWRVVGRNVLGSLFRSGFMDIRDLKATFDVSKIWREFAIPVYAWSVADYSKQINILEIDKIYAGCPRGHYLSDGAYKEVFKVFSARHKRLEAVSVMDIRAIESTGNQHIVRQEVAHSLLLSELVRSRFSPHFVEIYDVFLARERPHTKRWGSAECRKPVDLLTGRKLVGASRVPADTASDPNGLFQYIHMEFCDGGDVEDFIGLQENQLLPVSSVVLPFFFQMVFGVYSARERFNMRHCDIKLLNFFLKDISRKGLKCAHDEPLTLQYGIGDVAFNVQMPATFSYWVKLADYGTADSNVENLGEPVTLDQFTTLENTPIEFLLEGDQAQQSFAADTFSLGLCLLHLFTGCAPYEEILEEVSCPAPLLQDLKRLWMSGKKNSPFTVLRRVGQDDTEDVLMHTLYRYVVLFGLPTENPSASKQIDRVWTLLIKYLRPDDMTGTQPARQSSRRAAATSGKKAATKSPTEQFQEDYARFNVANGNHPVIKRARDRMTRVAGAQELLLSLVAFNPSERPTLKRTLFHDVFKTMRVAASDNSKTPRPVHYTIDCYAAEKFPADRLPDV